MKMRSIAVVYVALFFACVIAAIYLMGGWIQLFLDFRVPALILMAFILLLLLTGGIQASALAYFDALSAQALTSRLERYKRGLSLLRSGGRQLFLWGAIGVLVGFFVLVNNLDETRLIGSALSFADSCILMVLICRVLFVHPAAMELESKIAAAKYAGEADMIRMQQDKPGPWLYLLTLFFLPVIGVVFFLALDADMLVFIIPGAAFIVPAASLFISAAGVGFERIFAAISTALGGKQRNRIEIEQASSILKRLGLISIELGAAGFVIKLIIMLAVLEEPEAIFGQFALGLVPVFYGLYIAAVFCFPLASRLELHSVEET